MYNKVSKYIAGGKPEGWFWLIAITLLAMTDPDQSGHFSLCLFRHLGIDFCQGCGLGHGIALLFRGRLIDSFHAHPLALPAVVILLRRSYQLLFVRKIKTNQK